MWPFKCSHVYHTSDMINIEDKLPAYVEIAFDESKKHLQNLADWRIIAPCRKCGEVAHAACGLNLNGKIVCDMRANNER